MAKQINVTAPPGADAEQWVAKIKVLATRHHNLGDIEVRRITDLFRYYIERDWNSPEHAEWLNTDDGMAAMRHHRIKRGDSF